MRLLVVAVALAGCHDDIEHFPTNPGGNNPPATGSGGPDAPVDAVIAGDGGVLTGQVCAITDLRRVNVGCAPAGGLTVRLGTQTATSAADGTFTIAQPAGSTLVWHVFDPNLANPLFVPSVVPFSTTTRLPVMPLATYDELLAQNGVLLADQQGTIVASLVRGNAPLVNARVVSNPVTPNATFYDGNSALTWDQDETGTFGIAWLPGADVGAVGLTVTPQAEGAQGPFVTGVENGAITYVTIDLL